MTKKLEDIGFYTLEDGRAKNTSISSPLWRCELLLTSRCNFKCPYCRGVKDDFSGDLSLGDAKHVVDLWADGGLRNVRFSGGEPTVWKPLPELIKYTASKMGLVDPKNFGMGKTTQKRFNPKI